LNAEVPGLQSGRQGLGFEKGVGRVSREDVIGGREQGQREGIAARHVAPRVVEVVGTAGLVRGNAPGSVLPSDAISEESSHGVKEDTSADSNGGAAVTAWIKDETETGGDIEPVARGERLVDARIAIVVLADWSIGEDLAGFALDVALQREDAAAIKIVLRRKGGLP